MSNNTSNNHKPKLLLLVTEDWYFWSHRRPIAAAAKAAGFEVLIASRFHEHEEPIRKAGFKPVLYGSWAAMIARVPAVVNALAGLGHVFIAKGRAASLYRLTILAYRLTLGVRRTRLIFQNPDDQNAFVQHNVVVGKRTALIRGAGVDLDEFKSRPEPEGTPTLMLAGRLLWNKGVGDLVEAARLLKQKGIQCRVVLVGVPDETNPRAIPEEILRQWEDENAAEWWGRRDDMQDVLAQATLVVLPTTYGEGVPKVLIEAAAVGRAIVATDVTGCREIVRHEENGLLVPPSDVPALADAIETLLQSPQVRARMGRKGREIVEAEFSQRRVVKETLDVYRELLGKNWPRNGQSDESK